jgi:hypothetical protein
MDGQIIIRAVRLACATLGLAVLAAAGEAHAADAVNRVERTFALPRQGLRLDATIADVTVVAAARVDVAVEVVQHAPSAADLASFPVLFEADSERITVSAIQTRDGRDPRLKSEITIKTPPVLRLEAVRVFEGRIRVSGIVGLCDVDLRRGPVEAIDLAGRVRLETGLGNIDVTNAQLVAGGMLRVRAFNGSVRVQLARAPEDARILAVTFNGTITSDIPLTMKDQFGPRFGETTIGSGEPVLSIDVVKGDIAIGVRK